MRDLWRSIFCLAQLEQEKAGITIDRLHASLAEKNLNPPVIRTLQREIERLEKNGFTLNKKGYRYHLNCNEKNLYAFLELVQTFSKSAEGKKYFYGTIDTRRLTDYFSGRSDAIKIIYLLLSAIRERCLITFDYTPQSDITRHKMLLRAQFQVTDRSIIPVRLLPHFLVAGGNSFLILGEYYEKRALFGQHYKEPVVRHYELCGLENLQLGEHSVAKLKIQPEEIYRNSVHIWAGGQEHEVELEELWYDGGKPRRRKRKVNGEDEILSLAAGSLGRIRIINPPEALQQRAREIGLPTDLIFRFEK